MHLKAISEGIDSQDGVAKYIAQQARLEGDTVPLQRDQLLRAEPVDPTSKTFTVKVWSTDIGAVADVMNLGATNRTDTAALAALRRHLHATLHGRPSPHFAGPTRNIRERIEVAREALHRDRRHRIRDHVGNRVVLAREVVRPG